MKGNRLGTELRRLRDAAGLDVHQVASRTRGKVSAAAVILLETNLGTGASPVAIRALAAVYGVTPWSLLAAAGYVTDQDARDGLAATRAA